VGPLSLQTNSPEPVTPYRLHRNRMLTHELSVLTIKIQSIVTRSVTSGGSVYGLVGARAA
jgi:hypothetical protein